MSLEFRVDTSGGPGGQHANVTRSRVEVRFDVAALRGLGERSKELLIERLGPVACVPWPPMPVPSPATASSRSSGSASGSPRACVSTGRAVLTRPSAGASSAASTRSGAVGA